jgi:tetratricopeptide (TPR) repeat protein
MKNLLRAFIAILFAAGLIFWAYKAIVRQKQVNSPDYILKQLNIQTLVDNAKEFLVVHKAYLQKLKEFEKNIKKIGSKIQNQTRSAKALSKIGDSYSQAQFLELAAKYYQLGLIIAPQDDELNYKLGLIYANLGMFYPDKKASFFERAAQLYKKATQFNSRNALPFYALAMLYMNAFEQKISLGSLKEALENASIYKKLAPNRPNGYFLSARISFLLGNKGEAIRNYQIILNMVKPNSRDYREAQINIREITG